MIRGQCLVNLQRGDEVAVFKALSICEADVLEIGVVQHVTSVYITLVDGRIYATIGGVSLMASTKTYIVPATDEHRAILRARYAQTVESAGSRSA